MRIGGFSVGLSLVVLFAVQALTEEKSAEIGRLKGGEMVFVPDFDFYIDKYEVTNAEYAEFLNAAGNREEQGVPWLYVKSHMALIEEKKVGFVAKKGVEGHPVVEVSAHGARAYCRWAGKRLPLAAEWRQACEGKQELRFPWGDIFEKDRANTYGTKDGYARTAPVGSFPTGASPCGAMDMGGNVWEWTESADGVEFYMHGGSWVNGGKMARCSFKASASGGQHAYIYGHSVGFRCAR